MKRKINKETIKNYWEANKKKIFAIGGTAVGMVIITSAYYIMIEKQESELKERLKSFVRTKPTRVIPDTDGFKILDIAEDTNDGCVTWLDGCKLSDCGKLGEGLTKIERVNPDMMVTMAILAKDKLEL